MRQPERRSHHNPGKITHERAFRALTKAPRSRTSLPKPSPKVRSIEHQYRERTIADQIEVPAAYRRAARILGCEKVIVVRNTPVVEPGNAVHKQRGHGIGKRLAHIHCGGRAQRKKSVAEQL